MLRHRVIAAAPARRATETWDTIVTLVADTLDRSATIDRAVVVRELTAAQPAGLMLIAGGHLERHPLTLIADPIHVEITTVSGDDAMHEDENLEPIVGGASATDWLMHFPTPEPVGDAIAGIVADVAHLTVDAAPEPAAATAKASAQIISAAGLDALGKEGSR